MVGALAAKVDPLLGLRHEWGHRGARARQAVRSAIARVDWVRFCPNRASADGAYHASVDSGWEGQQRAKRRRWGARIHRSRHASTLYRGKPPETSNPLAVWRKCSTRELGSDLVSHAGIIPRAYCDQEGNSRSLVTGLRGAALIEAAKASSGVAFLPH
jgi:hypothetical protein